MPGLAAAMEWPHRATALVPQVALRVLLLSAFLLFLPKYRVSVRKPKNPAALRPRAPLAPLEIAPFLNYRRRDGTKTLRDWETHERGSVEEVKLAINDLRPGADYFIQVQLEVRGMSERAALDIRDQAGSIATFTMARAELREGLQHKAVEILGEGSADLEITVRGSDGTRLRRVSIGELSPQGVVPSSLCAIVRTYEAQTEQLPALLASLTASGGADLSIYVLSKGADAGADGAALDRASENNSVVDHYIATLNRVLNRRAIRRIDDIVDERERLFFLAQSRLSVPDYGYVRTDLTLRWLGEQRACDKLLVTNGDNLYGYDFFPTVRQAMTPISDALAAATFFVHDYPQLPRWQPSERWGALRGGRDVEFEPQFVRTRVDLGAIVTDMAFLMAEGIDFVLSDLEAGEIDADGDDTFAKRRIVEADGVFAEYVALHSHGRVAVIPQTLFVHQ